MKSILSALIGLCCAFGFSHAALAVSPPGDVVGRVTVGYQGWFSCAGDGAPIGGWWHYSGGAFPTLNTLSNGIHCWPDLRQFTKVYQTGYTNFGNGQPATLFSSYDQQTVNTHFRWMAENGIDTAALQRFNPNSPEGPTRDAMATKVRAAAETYGRKFYIMYDVTGWATMQSEIKADWTTKMSAHTASSAYARQNGKPVVCIWGFAFTGGNAPGTPSACLEVINWFKGQGCYVIGGIPREWRSGTGGCQPGFTDVFHAFNMISPWLIGAVGNSGDADNIYNNLMIGDQADCNANGIDYQPCVLPGDVVVGGQRSHGNLEWRMFYNATRLGCQAVYISMFDEFNEGNQIACTAENASMSPIGTASLYGTLNEDGTACSSDYYLRLTGDGGRMFKGINSLTSTRPTVPMFPVVSPTAPASLIAKSGNGQVVLNWNAVTGAADVASYNVKRATLSGGSYTTIATNVGNVGFTDTNVVNNTTYYYVVSALNSLGESTNSIETSVTPVAYYVVNSGGGAADPFTADANFSGGSTGGTGNGIDTSAVTNPAPQAVYQSERWGNNTYSFSGLSPGTNYKVRLHFAEIFYTAVGIRVFNVFINGSQVLANFDVFAVAGANYKAVIREFIVPANGVGQIVIQYANIAGRDNAKSSGIEILPINNALPPIPSGLAATTVSSTEINLSWTASAAANSYNVKRSTVNGGTYTNIATGVTGTAFWDAGLVPNTTYYYSVSAVNGNGESTNTLQASVTTQVLPAPARPTALYAASVNGQIILNWNGCGWATGYNVKRATVSGGPYAVIATNLAGVSYANSGLVVGTSYYFVVSATNAAGESANSSELSVIPGQLSRTGWVVSASSTNLPDPPANAIDGNIGTRWATGANQTPGQLFRVDMGTTNIFNTLVLDPGNSTADYPRSYQVHVSNDGSNWGVPVVTGSGATVTTIRFAAQTARYIRITQTGSSPANWWGIAELNVYGTSGPLPAAPASLMAAAGVSQVALNWNSSLGATSYNVKRATVSGGPYVAITNGVTTNYNDTGLSASTTYYYVVSAVGTFGEGGDSAPASATTQQAPPGIAIAASGDAIELSWPSNYLGWHLQVQTNSPGLGLTTNWTTVPGSDSVTGTNIPINPDNGSTFFRLIYP